ncbi:TPA: hypothetical protein ACRRD7_000593 [Enterobacter hormaechei]|uniref:hypothetical protein n=1 Tax=Enterobacter hormaechei TaxID=158836 RepID=UPI003D721DBA
MSTTLNEWLQKTIAELEEERDATQGAVNEDAAMALAAMKLALASLEAEPVAWDYESASYITCEGPQKFKHIIAREAPPEWAIDEGLARNIVPLYTAPPAPASVPDEEQCKPHPVMAVKGELGFLDHFDRIISERDEDIDIDQLGSSNYEALMLAALDAFRAAMLQGAEPVTTAYKLPGDLESFISWLTSGDGIPDWLINGDKLDDEKTSFLLKAYRAGAHSVDGKENEGIFVSKSSEMSVSDITINGVNGGESRCSNSPVTTGCSCRNCRPVTMTDMRFVVCPDCGNKRCPHANDHRNGCTGSNEPGQEGSAYPAAPQQEAK